ncbi:MAG: GNAT family N-acetyltransferase [Desulfovibrionaceae bacterium]
MDIRLQFDMNGVDWQRAAEVIGASLVRRDPERLRNAFLHSAGVVFAFDGAELVGMGRGLSDGEFQTAIYDLCLLPAYQGRGLGSRMLRALLERLPADTVLLYAVPGKEAFYERFGFRVMTTAMGLFRDPERMQRMGYLRAPDAS